MFVPLSIFITVGGGAAILVIVLGVAYMRTKRSEKAKTEFLSIAAHHIRTPLTLVKWTLAEFLEGNYGSFTDEQKHMFENLIERNEQLVRFVRSLLDVTRIEKKSTVLHKERVSMSPFLEELFRRLEPLATKRGMQFSKEVASGMPECLIDAEAVSRVLENIVENAVVYNKPQGSIEAKARTEGSGVVIRVRDTGIGISKNELLHIGAKFFRAKNAKQHAAQGTGLGVFTAREIVRMHGGNVAYESTEGKGTTVIIRLPVASGSAPVAKNGK
ncbi:MAG: hypothetical protein COU47_01690 [Candidatus Niyogibacteria bacterium CG10_big_fil_rev_8_21_14_0_10_46_36]|uniref:histidine kinase n=1 Tax=Candidatus Niyogibacteria bacterium CG10_big_fil_rev_8_21_14_0_10_46_36 TaxID=1974726 RepID=A0A2H0TDZ9_9BACT|nr:MAG: hypothetical protein COU47_01690 [Candidatus Niyogibacteria bacterium CG10_big_fil_rev_8_21_14_0_10_46_36]